jgi:hypothetical protein
MGILDTGVRADAAELLHGRYENMCNFILRKVLELDMIHLSVFFIQEVSHVFYLGFTMEEYEPRPSFPSMRQMS